MTTRRRRTTIASQRNTGFWIIAAGFLLAMLAWSWLWTPRGRAAPRLVILISIDTLRADALSCYGNERATTPHLDRLAEDGVRFSSAIAESPWTLPSHAALLSSLRPLATGVHNDRPLSGNAATLAELLKARGYRTQAVVASEFLDRAFGFDQGFDGFVRKYHRSAPESVDRILGVLERNRERRLFVFLHLYDVHGPYWMGDEGGSIEPLPGPKVPEQLGSHEYLIEPFPGVPTIPELRRQYEAGVTRVDRELGRLFDRLRESGDYDDALIAVTSDHGEAFFENEIWIGHGLFLTEPELRIPLILKAPLDRGWAGRRVEGPAGLVDVLPTLLDLVDGSSSELAQGRSLLAAIEAGSMPESSHVVSVSGNMANSLSIRTSRWRYVAPMATSAQSIVDQHLQPDEAHREDWVSRIPSQAQLYDLEADPEADHDLALAQPEVVNRLRALLEREASSDRALFVALGGESGDRDVVLDEAARRRLEALGYLR